jgi:hypothetical protein
MITRTTILDLANQAAQENNDRLRNLLLTVAGMLSSNGTVVSEPGLDEKWQKVSGCEGAYGRGLLYLQNRGKRLTLCETLKSYTVDESVVTFPRKAVAG